MLLGPFSGFSWILVTFLSAFAVLSGIVQPAHSLFNNPVYMGIVAVPFAISMASGAWALWVQGLMTARNVVLIPMLGYVTGAMLGLASIAFFYGVFDRTGFFMYRTPQSGSGETSRRRRTSSSLTNDRNAIVEGSIALAAIVLAVAVFLHGVLVSSLSLVGSDAFVVASTVLSHGVWFLSLSLVGFGIFTLKSMNLTRHLRRTRRRRRKIPSRHPARAASSDDKTHSRVSGNTLNRESGRERLQEWNSRRRCSSS